MTASRSGGGAWPGSAVVASILALIFLWLGWPFVQWLAAGRAGNPLGVVWPDGTPVPYFRVELGAAWRDVGLFATAVVLAIEALFYGVIAVRPPAAGGALLAVVVVAAAGVLSNAVCLAMQLHAGFGLPLLAVVGGVVCGVSATTAAAARRPIRADQPPEIL